MKNVMKNDTLTELMNFGKESKYDLALQNFLTLVKNRSDNYYAKFFPTLVPNTFEVTSGKRFDKVLSVSNNRGQKPSKCIYVFIEKSTGNIYKAASFSAPAKHVRGNIYGENPLAGTNEYGADYLK